jgi:hypothetical protein
MVLHEVRTISDSLEAMGFLLELASIEGATRRGDRTQQNTLRHFVLSALPGEWRRETGQLENCT